MIIKSVVNIIKYMKFDVTFFLRLFFMCMVCVPVPTEIKKEVWSSEITADAS